MFGNAGPLLPAPVHGPRPIAADHPIVRLFQITDLTSFDLDVQASVTPDFGAGTSAVSWTVTQNATGGPVVLSTGAGVLPGIPNVGSVPITSFDAVRVTFERRALGYIDNVAVETPGPSGPEAEVKDGATNIADG
ncbi:MAG: hypothetical protein NTW86_10505, partial [Candidatus Sumerlaeota bacterium]|nr:hypothetical protein [Candidatus Sumerlaeota bacterium]